MKGPPYDLPHLRVRMAAVVKRILGLNSNYNQICTAVWRFSCINGYTYQQLPQSAQLPKLFSTCSYCLAKRTKRTWLELPYPELKPASREDYDRWRTFAKYARKPIPEPYLEFPDEKLPQEIFKRINQQILTNEVGRLFAVVQIGGKQFKITTEDIIVVQGIFPPIIGDEIMLEKILLVGSKDFTILGRPLLNKDFLKIEASVIEKTFSHVVTVFRMKRRKQYRRTYFVRTPYTMLRINNIKIRGLVDEFKEIEGLEDHVIS